MTPFQKAYDLAKELGINFNDMMKEHLTDGYVFCSPDCFICAFDTSRDYGDYSELAVFVTLAVGNLDYFVSIDPLREKRKWLGFCREHNGEPHWIPYQRLRKRLATSQK